MCEEKTRRQDCQFGRNKFLNYKHKNLEYHRNNTFGVELGYNQNKSSINGLQEKAQQRAKITNEKIKQRMEIEKDDIFFYLVSLCISVFLC